MKILILGAGRVGESVAESLVSEQNDITVIDTDPQRLALLQDRLDLRGVVGNGIEPSVLRDAGAEDADMLIACAPLDETNLVACKIAYELFHIPTRIARVRSPEFTDGSPLMRPEGFAVDEVICPEESLTTYIRKLIEYPEALQVLEFSQQRLSLIAVRAMDGGPMVQHVISELPALVPDLPMRIVAIYRRDARGQDMQVICDGSTRIEHGDELFVLAANEHIRGVLDALHTRSDPVRRVIVTGGGRVGLRLARQISDHCQVKIVEASAPRCEYLATQLPSHTLVLHGDSTDEELLEHENVQDTDLFLALTSDDEDNIMSCLLAKRMGAQRVLALINRRAYADLVQGQGTQIDIAVSPAQTLIGELLAHVRRGDVAAVYSLRRGDAEALEAVVRGDAKSSKVVGRRIEQLPLPPGAMIGAIVREGPGVDLKPAKEVIIAHHDTVIRSGDHVIVFLPRKRMVRQVERLFQVGATFFDLATMNTPLAVTALVGRMIALFAMLMAVPLAFALSAHDPAERAFLIAIGVTFAAGGLLSLATRRFRRELHTRDGFVLVALTWLVLPAFAALPLLLAIPGLSFTDAYFEAVSGLTTTGATVLTGLDALPRSVNVWRCLLVLVGGLGIIVLAVAILPLLGVGAAQLFKAESAGPMKDTKLTPRIAETARGLWGVYFTIAALCFVGYAWAGMSWADAFMHMCATMGLGGFSSYDASFGHWNSPLIEAVAVVFMMLAGVSMALYFLAWRQRSLRVLWRNVEARAFVAVVCGTIALVSVYIWLLGAYDSYPVALRHTVFHVVSIATTTGFAAQDFALWPAFAPMLMLLVGCFATCAGSTGGGIKMARMLLLLKQSQHELVRIVHPDVVNPVLMGGQVVSPRVMQNVIAYMMAYGATLVVLTMLLLFSGLDVVSAFTAVVACVNNIGPGLGEVGPATNYGSLSDFQTWVCTAGMLLGRLELLALLVLFTPQFWRR